MDDRLISIYEQELRHLRETALEFGRAFPSIAPGLAFSGNPPDPYVERLLEGVAFMAARVRLKLDAQFPKFIQSMMESVYPDFLCPVPSMAVVRLRPRAAAPPPPQGQVVTREHHRITAAPIPEEKAARASNDPTACRFTLGHDVRLLPIELVEAEVVTRRLRETGVDLDFSEATAALRLRLRRTTPDPWSTIALDPLVVFVRPGDGLGYPILRDILSEQIGVAVADPSTGPGKICWSRKGRWVKTVGFEPETALLPTNARSFEGFRFLREYFAFPERLMFFEVRGIEKGVGKCEGETLDLFISLKRASSRLEQEVSRTSFELFCAPVINLFPKQFSQIIEPERFSEFLVTPDANRPLDYEVYSISAIEGYSESFPTPRTFHPFYRSHFRDRHATAFFTAGRQPRLQSESESKSYQGEAAVFYPGSDVFIALVDQEQAPYAGDLQQLDFQTLCTNRHLPILLQEGGAWTLDGGVKADVELLLGPTVPSYRPVDGEYGWKLLNLFSLNHLSLVDNPQSGAAALREILGLCAVSGSESSASHIEALRNIRSVPITRPLYSRNDSDSPPALNAIVRGLEISVEIEESALRDHRLFLLSSVLNEFFARYVSLNSFTETVFKTWPGQREWVRWPWSAGIRAIF